MRGLALEVALWYSYSFGESKSGKSIVLENNNSEKLRKTSIEARGNPLVFLKMEEIFGDLR